ELSDEATPFTAHLPAWSGHRPGAAVAGRNDPGRRGTGRGGFEAAREAGLHLRSAWRSDEPVDAGERRHRFRVSADPAAAGTVPRARQRDQRADPAPG